MVEDKKNIKSADDSKELPKEEVLGEESTTEEAPVEEATAEETPVEEVVSEEAPVEEAVAQSLNIPFIIGKKIGMTRLFDDEGMSYTVTLVEAGPCYVTQIKSKEKDGYSAVQLGYGDIKESKLNKPQLGHLKDKHLKHLKEYRMDDISDDISVGGEINVNLFDPYF